MLNTLKNVIFGDRERSVRILFGPFRGARLHTKLKDNIRKVLGLYEHELNGWLEKVLPQVDAVLDVGANDGYFTYGCAAAFKRLKRPARIIALEPQEDCCRKLRVSSGELRASGVEVTIEQTFAGKSDGERQTTLDALATRSGQPLNPHRTLVKIDVEGAEVDVIDGASLWLNPTNFFAIEVHHESFLGELKARFAALGIHLEQHDQRPLPILGAEHRPQTTWFLVSKLD